MLMPTVTYRRGSDCEDDVKRRTAIGKNTKVARETYEGLPIYKSSKINLQKRKITLTLISL